MNTPNRLRKSAFFIAAFLGAQVMSSLPADAAPNNNVISVLQADTNKVLGPLGMPQAATNGKFSGQTARAACAKSWLTTGVATTNKAYYTPTKIKELDANDAIRNPYLADYGTRVANGFIVNKTCQVMAVTSNNAVVGVYPVSTGRPGYDTPNGLFTIYKGINGWHESSKYPTESGNGNMYKPVYFGPDGIALHGSREMSNSSTTPQSHGCVRLTTSVADAVFSRQGGDTHAANDAIVTVTHSPVAVIGKFGN